MGRTNFFQQCLLSLVALAAVAIATVSQAAQRNVVFIVADDLNNHLGCYGFPVRTPALDSLARRAMRFDRAYCQAPLCNPSRVSFLSGLRPDRTGVHTLATFTREHLGDWVMLPEYFRKHGYFTVQVGKIFHTKDGFEDPRSWDVEIRESGAQPPEDQIIKSWKQSGENIDREWDWLRTADEDTPDGKVARTAVNYMDRAIRDKKPFFLGVGFRRPHGPFAAPKKYFDLYPPADIALPKDPPSGYRERLLRSSINYPGTDPNYPGTAPSMTELEKRELIAAYYACTSFMDAQVGVVLEALDARGLWKDTVVVFIGDHGYHLGEHGGLWRKNSLFEESARAPLIIYAPGMKAAGASCNRLAEFIDIYPTLVSLCGLPARDGLDGINLAPLLDDPSLPTKTAAFTVITRSNNPADHSLATDYLGRSVRTERWRYTEWDEGKRGAELYDHDADPGELNNLANDLIYAETVQRLRRMLHANAMPIAAPE